MPNNQLIRMADRKLVTTPEAHVSLDRGLDTHPNLANGQHPSDGVTKKDFSSC